MIHFKTAILKLLNIQTEEDEFANEAAIDIANLPIQKTVEYPINPLLSESMREEDNNFRAAKFFATSKIISLDSKNTQERYHKYSLEILKNPSFIFNHPVLKELKAPIIVVSNDTTDEDFNWIFIDADLFKQVRQDEEQQPADTWGKLGMVPLLIGAITHALANGSKVNLTPLIYYFNERDFGVTEGTSELLLSKNFYSAHYTQQEFIDILLKSDLGYAIPKLGMDFEIAKTV